MDIANKTRWVAAPRIRYAWTPEGLTLVALDRVMYCDLAVLAGAVWLLIDWTPTGITVKEIVDLLETVAPLRRRLLETETCKTVTELVRNGFVRKLAFPHVHEARLLMLEQGHPRIGEV
jgi:hypothetical protein